MFNILAGFNPGILWFTSSIRDNPSVTWEVDDDGIGYMRISTFGDDTTSLAQQAAEEFVDKGVKGIVLDLRSNTGGYVDAAQDFQEIFSGPLIEYAMKLKKSGHIHYLGVSSHKPEVARLAVESGLVDVLMFSINPAYDLQPPDEVVEKLCRVRPASLGQAGRISGVTPAAVDCLEIHLHKLGLLRLGKMR